jgi:hypothetical protein
MEYLIYKKSKWVKINMNCPRDNEQLYTEQLSDGKNTNHFACGRLGCTWPSYPENIKKIELHTNILKI